MAPVIEIRDEHPDDADAVRQVNRQAFEGELEGRIIDALRARGAVRLSLVAVADEALVGHIVFSPLTVGTVAGAALGPMAVLPAWQRQGIGSQLVTRGIDQLRNSGCPFVVLIGHPPFYTKFGFEPAAEHGLTCEWDVPAEAFMVKVLDPDVLPEMKGPATYQAEFSWS